MDTDVIEDTIPTVRRCAKCGETKPLTEFKKDSRLKHGYGYWCQACNKQVKHEWYLKNADKAKRYFHDYYHYRGGKFYSQAYLANKRAKKRGLQHDLTPEQIRTLFKDNPRCQYCGIRKSAHVDHYVPLNLGGPSTISNIRAVCVQCSMAKSRHPMSKVWKNGQVVPYNKRRDPIWIQTRNQLLKKKRAERRLLRSRC